MMAFDIGHVSGCHLNPAVSIGLAAAGRFPVRDLVPYIVASGWRDDGRMGVLSLIAPGFDLVTSSFAANSFRRAPPGQYTMVAALVSEVVMTFCFLFVILGATDERALKGFAPIAIGLCLTLIHLISIPVTNTSVNPARSTGPALFVGGWVLDQLWLFWIAPIIGAIVAGLLYPSLTRQK